MFIQFGYVVLFSSAFPLAGLCALLNNVVEIRSDAFKLCTNLQRPFGVRVENIGTWQVMFFKSCMFLRTYQSLSRTEIYDGFSINRMRWN